MQRRFVITLLLLITTYSFMKAQQSKGQYAAINGLQLYYEIHGNGYPLVLLHGGGSTITTTWGRILPELAKNHKVIAIELQAHGHTADIDRPLSFEQDADDVAALLRHLKIEKADIMGFSNGATTALQAGIRHPQVVNKLVLASIAYRRDALPPGFFEGMKQATLKDMPQPYHEAYLAINPDPQGLQAMFSRDTARMINFKDIPDAAIQTVQAPALIISGDKDVTPPEHSVALSRTLPHAQLAILPCGHGDYIGEILSAKTDSTMPAFVVSMINAFLAGK